MGENDTPTDTSSTSGSSADDTVQFNVEIPRRLHKKWKRAVRKKHGKYRGASKQERLRMIESWADAILSDDDAIGPEPSNRDVIDVLTERIGELEDRIIAADVPVHVREGSSASDSKNNNRNVKQASEYEGFWDAYDPDEKRTVPLSKSNLREVPSLVYPEINSDHIDSDELPGFQDVRASIVAAVLRYEFDEVHTGHVVGTTTDVLPSDDPDYARRDYLGPVTDEFEEHPEQEGVWYTTPEAYEEAIDEMVAEQMADYNEFAELIGAVLTADSEDELKTAVDEIDAWGDGALQTMGVVSAHGLVREVRESAAGPVFETAVDEGLTDESAVEVRLALLRELEDELRGADDVDAVLGARPSEMGALIKAYKTGCDGDDGTSGV